MQKVKNVKLFLFLFILFSNNIIFSQHKIVGKYKVNNNPKYIVDGGEYSSYEFFKKNIFEKKIYGEFGLISFGKGHYYTKNDSLILNYNLTKLKEESFYKLKKYYNSKDSILLELKISDFNKNLLHNISVIGDFESRYGTLSDYEGKAFLKFKKEKGIQKITISDLCCGNYSFYVDTELNSKIDIYLSKGFKKPKLIKKEVKKYKIIEITKEYIKLKDRKKEFILIKQ